MDRATPHDVPTPTPHAETPDDALDLDDLSRPEPTLEAPDHPRRAGVWLRSGQYEVCVDGAIYAWTEPRFHAWSSVLPLLLLPPAVHVLGHDDAAPHSHTWLWAFLLVWLAAWLLAVPYECRVAYADGRVGVVRCATRGGALRLAGKVCRHLGVPPAHGA